MDLSNEKNKGGFQRYQIEIPITYWIEIILLCIVLFPTICLTLLSFVHSYLYGVLIGIGVIFFVAWRIYGESKKKPTALLLSEDAVIIQYIISEKMIPLNGIRSVTERDKEVIIETKDFNTYTLRIKKRNTRKSLIREFFRRDVKIEEQKVNKGEERKMTIYLAISISILSVLGILLIIITMAIFGIDKGDYLFTPVLIISLIIWTVISLSLTLLIGRLLVKVKILNPS